MPAEFFHPALKPWVHYVPTGFNGWEEVERVVQFLREHDDLARSIAANGQRFAATHLVAEGRHCYIKVGRVWGTWIWVCNIAGCS